MSEIEISTLAERPELGDRLAGFEGGWPEFILHDPIGNSLLFPVYDLFPEQCLVATDGDELIGHGASIPFVFPDESRPELPDGGWDRVLVWGTADQRRGREGNVSSALEIVIRPTHLGRGLSHRMLQAMRDAVKVKGHKTLYAPVRPNGKEDVHQPMTEYVEQVREDGLPVDAWLRVHVKAGGKMVKVAPTSMVVAGTPADWREWTGLPFDRDGDVVVPKALAPVHCDFKHNHAVYVEPNVWVRHDL